jgi:hypothetical protein
VTGGGVDFAPLRHARDRVEPVVINDVHYCPVCHATGAGACRLVFGMRSDGRFHDGKPQKRSRFNLARPIIATKACKCDGCGYWWPAFSFTPQAVTT